MESILGGAIIGLGASLFLLLTGRVTGISGIAAGLLKRNDPERIWRLMFIIGLIVGGLVFQFTRPQAFQLLSNAHISDYMFAGLLVGFGTVMGSGCTSGHGVCGLSRLSFRSLVATITFILSGILGLYLFKILRGGV